MCDREPVIDFMGGKEVLLSIIQEIDRRQRKIEKFLAELQDSKDKYWEKAFDCNAARLKELDSLETLLINELQDETDYVRSLRDTKFDIG